MVNTRSCRFWAKEQQGKLFECQATKTKIRVAIKVMKPGYTTAGRHEVNMLIRSNDRENMFTIKMLEYFDVGNSVCIVFEKMSRDLSQVLKNGKLSADDIKILLRTAPSRDQPPRR